MSLDSISIASISPYDSFYESILTYAIPLLSLIIGLDPIIFTILIGFVCILLYASSNSVPNPILRVLGYHFYKIDYNNNICGLTLISKKDILNASKINAGILISKYLVFDYDGESSL